MTDLTKSFSVKARDFVKAGEVSIEVQELLKSVGFPPDLIRRVSICAYESEMNVVMHGGDGTCRLTVCPKRITLEMADAGPGIEDIELALQEGYSTATPEYQEMGFGAGMGLPNIQKNADDLKIDSKKGKGTRLTITFDFRDGS
ncbi:MAG: ATP-binding protein [Deltaproteobacteria bacterium]|nr:ATP-binding protein [Deltaproteobacteria bacterium]MCF8120452.1 ATP-binding protein [Deltaproteobacteria bacterium]